MTKRAAHSISLSEYKSALVNTRLVEVRCSCGWMLRGMDEAHAGSLGAAHVADPSPYPTVLKSAKRGKVTGGQ